MLKNSKFTKILYVLFLVFPLLGAEQSGSAHHWVTTTSNAALPPNAVRGGHDIDGSPIYVGRAYHEGDCLPAKVIPSKGYAYVAHGGKEHRKNNYDVFVGNGLTWVGSGGGRVPRNAVSSGKTRSGETLYVGRAYYDNSLVVGKVHRSRGCLYLPFCGKEHNTKNYEVLVCQN